MDANRRTLILGGLLVLAAGGLAYVWYDTREQPVNPTLSPFGGMIQTASKSAVPILFATPQFSFVDQDGVRSSKNDLLGKIWVADYIFTNCHGVCPRVTAKFVALQKELTDPEFRFVSFSVDPQRDVPKVLKDYAAEHNPGEKRWKLLQPPDMQTINALATKMSAIQHPHDSKDQILHTDFFVLIDDVGHVRGLYDSKDDAAMDRLKHDANTLLKQLRAGNAAATQPD